MSRRHRVFSLVLVLALMLPTAVVASADQGPTQVSTASDAARAKIQPSLLTEIESAQASQLLQFIARIRAGTDLSPYTNRYFARPFIDPLGSTVAAGFATSKNILKMAADPGVIVVRGPDSIVEAPSAEDPDVAAMSEDIEPKINTDPNASPGPAPEGWYSTTGAVHGSQDAWAKGYTGAGVRYMSNDSGADYCHPDLHGTWAYIDTPGSPYYGLPQMFDSWSSYMAAYDYYVGTSYIADGLADFVDTSATATGNFSFAPLGAATAHNYVVPGTSLSGVYHYGSHPDKALADVADILSGTFGDGTAAWGERAAVLVVDEHTAGVYDTVYVDLNYNFDFSDDTPARLTRDFTDQEAACLDYDGDGLNDVSGGLVYFVSDGVTPVPTLDWYWGIPGSFFGNGDLVAFHVMDYLEGGGDHGMGTTSVAVGQGVVAGSLVWGPGGSPIAGFRGLVVGPGKDVLSTQNGDFYISPFIEDAYIYAGLGYDATSGTGDDVQIVSNSWGFSDVDNDGFDYESRLIDRINRIYAPNTALLFSTGNGAAGYGTVAPPNPPSSIGVGASTLYGTTGEFEAIASADQILSGDPMSWSNRGPGVRNVVGADVVATGAFGTGDVPLNEVLWGAVATLSFGGTSMAAPVAAGNLALIYQAWRDRTGSWPTFDQAKALLMSSAKNTSHDVWTQGGGLVDADEGTDVAGGHRGVFVTPTEWSVGDYRGSEYEAFTHIISPGETDVQEFTVHNPTNKTIYAVVTTRTWRKLGTKDYSFTSLDQSLDHGAFTTPDYVFRIDQDIPMGTDLLMVRVTKPYEQFDPTGNFGPYSNWRVHLQNWTDLNGDGSFWDDLNGNGKVDLDGEMQTGEHNRFSYGYNVGPTQQVRISNPLQRIDDGLLLTFRHRNRTSLVPTTDLKVEASFWHWTQADLIQVNRKRIAVPPGGTATLLARMSVPADAPVGMYQGAILVDYGGNPVVIPVTAAIAAHGTAFDFGKLSKSHNAGPLYDNEYVFGYTDYSWRAESGDWRFFWTDIDGNSLPASGANFMVVDDSWTSPGTDIDTIVLGPTPDGFGPPELYGPYTLEQVARSVYTYVGSGRWLFQTSSGGPRDVIAAPVQDGLHGILLHQVRVDGDLLSEPFTGKTGLVNVDPGQVETAGPAGPGSQNVTISSELALDGFVAEGFGLGGPVTTVETVNQDDPDDPSTASFVTTVTLDHAAKLEVSTCCSGNGSDIDLFVYSPGGQLVGSSTTPTDQEFVSLVFPADGTYTIAVHGWSVPAGTDTFELTINAVQGYNVTVTNLPASIPAGDSATLTVNWDTTGFAPGTYFGLVLMGPSVAPGLLEVPVTITVE